MGRHEVGCGSRELDSPPGLIGGGTTGVLGRVTVGDEVGLGGSVVVVVVVVGDGSVVELELELELDELDDELDGVLEGVLDGVVLVLVGCCVGVYVVLDVTCCAFGSLATGSPESAAFMKSSQIVAGVSPP